MVELSISDRDAALILSALSFFDDEVLPHSVPRITLYELLKYIQETFGFEEYEGHVPMAEERLSGEVRTSAYQPMQPIMLSEPYGVPLV